MSDIDEQINKILDSYYQGQTLDIINGKYGKLTKRQLIILEAYHAEQIAEISHFIKRAK